MGVSDDTAEIEGENTSDAPISIEVAWTIEADDAEMDLDQVVLSQSGSQAHVNTHDY